VCVCSCVRACVRACVFYRLIIIVRTFCRLTVSEDMKIDLKAKLIVSLIHMGYLDCFAVCLTSVLFNLNSNA